MRLPLEERAVLLEPLARRVERSDVAALGDLMLAAYRGTVDDEGETLEDAVGEVEGLLEGSYGPFASDASFVAEDDDGLVGASLVAIWDWESRPLLLYLVVRPEAKRRGISVVLVGHVTKEGALAGPRVLEHAVDTVLSFEGERHHALRLLRATKHRFGPTSELGLFEMAGSGLLPVPDPSMLFLSDRRPGTAGSVVVPTIEGQRPLLVEVQALVATSSLSQPRRSAQGFQRRIHFKQRLPRRFQLEWREIRRILKARAHVIGNHVE